ncbi:hypothetical protein WICMUC_003191 [Wickerhamomyces mucosus]|uniref:ERCC1-like central domain-containing protein n=1 Tax=Wickerhamomyces mucosus TaxID=1378264 RepID=A0A9P8TDM3_9ASCO|nr:hypothetical protein WICMUC_003191 [Wickerhamomyces mucosus]
MSGDGEDNTTDTTSFASILANVKRLRNEQGSEDSPQLQPSLTSEPTPIHHQRTIPHRPPQRPPINPSIGQKRTSAFNQDRSNYRSASPSNLSGIKVNKNQQGNPILEFVKNVNWEYVERRNSYDYLVNGRQIMYLSLKYHKLHPEHINLKMKGLMKKNAILLCQVDVTNNDTILREINKVCLYNEITLLLSFTHEQSGKYLTFLAQGSRKGS